MMHAPTNWILTLPSQSKAEMDELVKSVEIAKTRQTELEEKMKEADIQLREARVCLIFSKPCVLDVIIVSRYYADIFRMQINYLFSSPNQHIPYRTTQADKSESARMIKFNECVESMKRLFPGVHGRLDTLCKPRHRYD